MKLFPNVLKTGKKEFLNFRKIFPLQQNDVATLVECLSKDDSVEQIIIFGSSVTTSCYPLSDIDLFVKTNNKNFRFRPPKEVNVQVDLLTNYDVDEFFYNEILDKGVVIYEKKLC